MIPAVNMSYHNELGKWHEWEGKCKSPGLGTTTSPQQKQTN